MIDNLGCDCPVGGCSGSMVIEKVISKSERDVPVVVCSVCGSVMERFSHVSKSKTPIMIIDKQNNNSYNYGESGGEPQVPKRHRSSPDA